MSMTDPIADLFTRIRNAQLAKHDRLDVPVSKLKLEVCRILKEQGYISDFEELGEATIQKNVRIFLKYGEQGDPAIRRLQRVSKPGRRVYQGADGLRPVLNGLGIGIVSTSQGLMTDAEARDQRAGGEVLGEVW